MRAAMAAAPPPPGGESDEMIEPEETVTSLAVPPDDIDFDRYEEAEDTSDHPTFCLWCHVKQSKQEYKESKRLQKLIRFWEENKASMEPFEFCRRMQQLYNENMRMLLKDDDGDPIPMGPPWPARVMWEHDISHQLRPNAVLEDIARTMHTALRTLRDNGLFIEDTYTRTGTKKRRLDYTASKTYREIVKELRPILDKLSTSRNKDLYGLT